MEPAAVFRRCILAGDHASARTAASRIVEEEERLRLAEFAIRRGASFEALVMLRGNRGATGGPTSSAVTETSAAAGGQAVPSATCDILSAPRTLDPTRPPPPEMMIFGAEAESLFAWALFCEGRRRAAARQWSRSALAQEKRLGELLLAATPAGAAEGSLQTLSELAASNHSPVVAAASHLLAELFFAMNQPAKSLLWARKSEWQMPGWIDAKRLTARVAEAAGQRRLALERWRGILKRLPEDPEAHENLGMIELEEGRRPRARIHFRQSLEANPFNIDLRLRLGDLAMEDGDEAEALEHWETAHRLDPRNLEPLRRLVDSSWESGALEEALNWCRKLLALGIPEAEEEEHLEMVGYLYSELLLSGARLSAREVGDFFADALKRFPSNSYLEVYNARRLVAAEKYPAAEAILVEVIRRQPMMPEAIFELGHLYLLGTERRTEGLALLRRAARLDADPFYGKELGRHLLDAGEWKEAESWLKKALSSGLEDEETMLNLYLAHFHQKKYSAAENLLRQIMVRQPGHMQAALFLAEVILLKGKYADAGALVRKVLANYKTADDAVAVEKCPEAIIDPPGAVHWIAGYASLLEGRLKAAAGHFRKARAEAPDLEGWFEELNRYTVKRLAEDPVFAAEAGKVVRIHLPALKLHEETKGGER